MRAVLWDQQYSDGARRTQAVRMCMLPLPRLYGPPAHHILEACVRTIVGKQDRHVGIHLRPAALMALVRHPVPDEIVRRIAEFWWQGHT